MHKFGAIGHLLLFKMTIILNFGSVAVLNKAPGRDKSGIYLGLIRENTNEIVSHFTRDSIRLLVLFNRFLK